MRFQRAFSCRERSLIKAGPIPVAALLCVGSLCTLIASDGRTAGSPGPAQAEEVVSVTLSPSTVAGGSGETSTGTVTLNMPAPTGGAVVALTSSNLELAATMPSVTVPEGETTATFIVATNARYRAYSGLAFSVNISATHLTTQSATLNVTAQPRPADFNSGSTAGANTQWDGLMCGGIAPIGGQQGILYDCSPADETGFGTCTFRQECSLGCRRVPPNGTTYSDFCATSGPHPVAVSSNYFTSGDHVPASLHTEAPVTVPTTGVPRVINTDSNARGFSPDDVGGIHFPTGVGATSVPFDVATSYVPTIQFIDVGGYWYDDDIPPLLITSGRGGQVWAAMVPPNPPPAAPIPTPVQFKIVGSNPVTGGESSLGQVHTSGIPHGIGPTITFTSSHPDIVPAPAPFTQPAGNTLGFDVNLPTQPPAADTDVTLTATDGRYSFSAVLSVLVPPPPPVLADLTVDPTSVTGGSSATGTVILSAPQSGDTVVTLSTPAPSSVATMPSSVTVSAGATTASFTITTFPVTEQFNMNIFADLAGSPGQQALLLIMPGGSTSAQSLAIDPADVVGTTSTTGVVTLSGAAPSGGAVVTLSKALADGSAGTVPVTIPESVTVPQGQTSASFTIATSSVTATTVVRISAAYNGVTVNADMSVFTILSQVSFDGNVPGGTPATGTVTLRIAAPSGGAVVSLSSANTSLVTVPPSVTVPAGQTSATFTANTAPVTSTTGVVISASYDGVTVSTTLFLVVSRAVASVTLDPSTVTGGVSSTGTVTLRNTAPSGGAVVALASSNSVLAVVPSSVTVVAGQISATFPVNTASVTATQTVVISATYEDVTESATLTINPAASTATLSAVSLDPTSVVGGNASTGTVTLSAAAPGGGFAVSLSDNSTAASTPSSVTVPEGATTATFTVTTVAVTTTTLATVTATAGGTSRTADLTITAAGGGGVAAFLSPTANAPDSGGDGNGFESNPVNAFAADAAVATDTNSGSGTKTSCTDNKKDRHRFYDFGFTVPDGSTIAGLEVRLDARADSTSGSPRMCVQLSWNGGSNWTAAKATGTLGTSLATVTLGGATDTWGRTWSTAELTNANFRLRVINVAGSTARDFFLDWVAVRPHVATASPAALSAVSVNPTSVVGGDGSTGTVTLTSAAPTEGAAVSLSSSNTGAAGVPASVTVPAGATSATFAVTTSAVAADTSVTITATYSGTSRTATLTVTPVPPPVSLQSVSVNPTSVTGGTSSEGTVTLSSGAPAGGIVVSLSSSNTAAAGVPATVTVAAGATSATFTATTSTVSASTDVTISAVYDGATQTAVLTVNPPAGTATLTVTASGRSGETVFSSPAGISVNVGSTGSASFAAGTSITLSVSDSRDAIWSGACSSGGEKAKTCTFTLNADASVTANVQ